VPLVMDQRLDFWSAMELSRKVVTRHWWKLFGFTIVLALLSMGGLLACGVGIFVTVPVAIAALMYAYEDIFGAGAAVRRPAVGGDRPIGYGRPASRRICGAVVRRAPFEIGGAWARGRSWFSCWSWAGLLFSASIGNTESNAGRRSRRGC